MKKNEISKLRKELDEIDNRIAKLLSKRISKAIKIIEIKKAGSVGIEDSIREKSIVDRLTVQNPEISELLTIIYRRVFDWVKSL